MILPLTTGTAPKSDLANVVFPDPLGPSIAQCSLEFICQEVSCRNSRSRKRTVVLSRVIKGWVSIFSIAGICVFDPAAGFHKGPVKARQRKTDFFFYLASLNDEHLLFKMGCYEGFLICVGLKEMIDGRCRQLNGQHAA